MEDTFTAFSRHAIDPTINPTGLSLSIGRRDKYTEDNYSFCSASKQRLMNTKAKGYIQVSRKLFLTQNISKADKRKLGPEFLDRKERARKRTPKKREDSKLEINLTLVLLL